MLVRLVAEDRRELQGKPAGVRTHALVALGGSLLTVTSLQVSFTGTGFDPAAVTRVVQGIITGVGFLGAGVILRDDSRHTVHGLTTAASIWDRRRVRNLLRSWA